ncbi:MAG: hypothetical protein AAF799_17190 [Myxococcota bacterium]
MNEAEDDLLGQLGALEREYDDAFPEAWEDVVRGTRSADEVAAERLEAGDDPDEVEALKAELAPVSEVEREAWIDQLAEAAATSEPSPAAAEPDNVVSLGDRRSSRAGWVAGAVAVLVAAAVVLWLMPRDGGAPVEPGRAASTLPGFSLLVRNETVHEIRSADDGPKAEAEVYQARTQVHWVIRPERSVGESLQLRVLAEAQGDTEGAKRRLIDPGKITVSERGVVELVGTFGELFELPTGRWSLHLVLGSKPPADVAEFDAGGPWTVVKPAYLVDIVP